MRFRSSLIALVATAAALGGVALDLTGPAHAGPAPARAAPITVTGVLDRLAVDRVDGDDTRYVVRNDEGAWWLDGLGDGVPAPGSTVEVSGTEVDDTTIAVASLRVVRAGGDGTISRAPVSTKVLVMRAYWGANAPANPTTATAKQRIITDSQTWFGEVSHRRYTVTGSVTPWLRIPQPASCGGDIYPPMQAAVAAAQRAGYRTTTYGRFVLYLPCNAGGLLGYGSFPGPNVWLFATMDKQVAMHEQGHNLGLPHASSRACTRNPWGAVTWSSTCSILEYGDEIDSMGNRRPGHFNAMYKNQIGWLQSLATVSSSRTVTLRPYETTGSGVKAVRLRSGSATYWIEYRTRTGFDKAMPPGTAGVQIRYQVGNQTQLLDAGPGSTVGFYDFADGHLPPGSSWTTPQRVRIKLTSQSSSGATLAFAFGVSARVPGQPSGVKAAARVNAARISWNRPNDNGSIIRRYEITRLDNGVRRELVTQGGRLTSYVWDGLNPARTYRFAVRAVNEVGKSTGANSPSVRPLTDKPSISITNPAGGATVSEVVPVRFSIARNGSTNSPIQYVQLFVDGNSVGFDSLSPWEPFQWSSRSVANGTHTIRVTATDQNFKTATSARSVTVNNPAPTVAINSPAANANLSGDFNVTYTLTPGPNNPLWYETRLYVDGGLWAFAPPGDALSFNTTTLGPGQHTLQVRAVDQDFQEYSSPGRTVNFLT